MNYMIIFLMVLSAGTVFGRPQLLQQLAKTASNAVAYITSYENTRNELGEYSYRVETSDGVVRSEKRIVENPGTPEEKAKVIGFYEYRKEDGETHQVSYTADEDGFQPEVPYEAPQAASVRRRPPPLSIPSSAIATLAGGGGLGR